MGALVMKPEPGEAPEKGNARALMDEEGYVKYLVNTMVESMMRDSPDETREFLEEFK